MNPTDAACEDQQAEMDRRAALKQQYGPAWRAELERMHRETDEKLASAQRRHAARADLIRRKAIITAGLIAVKQLEEV